MIASKYRGWVYVAQVALSLVLAVLIGFGIVSKDTVLLVIAVAIELFGVFAGMLARMNLTSDPEA